MAKTDFDKKNSNTIKDILANFDDKHAKQDENFKETIADHTQRLIFVPDRKMSRWVQ